MSRARRHILFALGAIALALSAGAALAGEQRTFFVDVIQYGWHSGTHYGSYIDSEGQFRVGTHSGLHQAYYVVSVPVTREEFKAIQEGDRQQAVRARSLALQRAVPPLENQPRVPLTTLKGGSDAPRVPPLENQPRVPLRSLDGDRVPPAVPRMENQPRVPVRRLEQPDLADMPPPENQPHVPLRVLDRAPLGPVAPPLENMPRVPLRSPGGTPAGK